jgi:hypothetical protein
MPPGDEQTTALMALGPFDESRRDELTGPPGDLIRSLQKTDLRAATGAANTAGPV